MSISKRILIPVLILMIGILLLSLLPIHGEEAVYSTVVRLHVLANSDSEEDQALKLSVRDAVLEVTEPLLAGCTDRATAAERIEEHAETIRTAAEEVIAAAGREDLSGSVTVTLGEEEYPRRSYEQCTLPAGRYLSLRVCIGEAAGKNWWCVLFPPLCMSAASADRGSAEDAFVSVGLTKDQYSVITETGKTKYRVRFRVLELWENWFGD